MAHPADARADDLLRARGVLRLRHARVGPVLMADRVRPFGVPLLWGLPVGHEPRHLASPFGVPAVLDADVGTLVLREAPLP